MGMFSSDEPYPIQTHIEIEINDYIVFIYGFTYNENYVWGCFKLPNGTVTDVYAVKIKTVDNIRYVDLGFYGKWDIDNKGVKVE